MRATHRLFAFISLLLLIVSLRASAAEDSRTLRGVAVDSSGAALPGVTVTVTPAGQQNTEPLLEVTNEAGEFRFADLNDGTYEVVLSLPGFEEKRLAPVAVPASTPFRIVLAIAGLAETVVVRAVTESTSVEVPAGAANIEDRVLRAVPLATDRFEDALPLLPGTVRGPDGLLNMKGGRADQSALLVNGVNMTDPVTGHFAVRLPIEMVETLKVQGGVMSAAVGDATAGVTDVVVRSGSDTRTFQLQNFMPRARITQGHVRGIDAFTPRVHFAGPIRPGRLWYSQALNYRFVRSRVDEIKPIELSEQKVQSFDSLTQIDYAASAAHHIATTFVWFPSNIDNAGLDTVHPYDATPDLTQRGWSATVSDRGVLSSRMTLTTAVAVKQFDMAVAPKHDTSSLMTVGGPRNNYFNRFDRNSRRYDANTTLTAALTGRGDHLVSVGGQFAHVSFDGVDASHPVHVVRASGALARTIEFIGSPVVGASNSEVASFVEDRWSIDRRVTLQMGVRVAHEGIATENTLAPRVEAAVRPFSSDRTVVKGGVGQFYDKLPLNADSFDRLQSRRFTDFDADGSIVGTPVRFDNLTDAAGLRTPRTRTWNVELDQVLASDLTARIGFRRSQGSKELVVDPLTSQGVLLLSSHGRTQSREFEATLHRRFKQSGELTFSYVRARTEGNLNDFVSLFGDLRDPIIRADEFSRQPFDVPNRFLAWGVMNLPHAITVAPTIEYRNGFPYTVVNEQQDVVGVRNHGGRFPNLFTADLAVTKDVVLLRGQRARVGVQLFNITGHFNPRDVQNNVDGFDYLRFANSADRQIRAKFTLLF